MAPLYYSNIPQPAFPEVEVHPRLAEFCGSKRSVVIGANDLDGFIEREAEEAAGNIAWLLRDAAKKRKSKRLWGCFKLTLWLGAAAIGICAYNGIWEPLFYATAPIWYPLVLITDAYSSYAWHQHVAQAFAGAAELSEPQHAMSPVEKTGLVLGLLLMLILFKLDKLEQRK